MDLCKSSKQQLRCAELVIGLLITSKDASAADDQDELPNAIEGIRAPAGSLISRKAPNRQLGAFEG